MGYRKGLKLIISLAISLLVGFGTSFANVVVQDVSFDSNNQEYNPTNCIDILVTNDSDVPIEISDVLLNHDNKELELLYKPMITAELLNGTSIKGKDQLIGRLIFSSDLRDGKYTGKIIIKYKIDDTDEIYNTTGSYILNVSQPDIDKDGVYIDDILLYDVYVGYKHKKVHPIVVRNNTDNTFQVIDISVNPNFQLDGVKNIIVGQAFKSINKRLIDKIGSLEFSVKFDAEKQYTGELVVSYNKDGDQQKYQTTGLVVINTILIDASEVTGTNIDFGNIKRGYDYVDEKVITVLNPTDSKITIEEINLDTSNNPNINQIFEILDSKSDITLRSYEAIDIASVIMKSGLDVGLYTGRVEIIYNVEGVQYRIRSYLSGNVIGVSYEGNVIKYIDTDGNEFPMGTITITDGVDSITMLDRNLGATKPGTGKDSYGYYFQWGNNYGFGGGENGSSKFMSGRGKLTAVGAFVDSLNFSWNNPYLSSNFVLGKTKEGGYDVRACLEVCDISYVSLPDKSFLDDCVTKCREEAKEDRKDWAYPHNGDIRGAAAPRNDYFYSRQGPCPEGYHVPTKDELDDLVVLYYSLYGDGYGHQFDGTGKIVHGQGFIAKFSNDFLVPKAGIRDGFDGKMVNVGTDARITSSSLSDFVDHEVNSLHICGDDITTWPLLYKVQGVPVRCFKDKITDDEIVTLSYSAEGFSIQSQTLKKSDIGFIPYELVRSGIDFDGWYRDSGYNNKIEFETGTIRFKSLKIDEDLTIYAKRSDDRVIKFDNKGIGDSVDAQIVKVGSKVNEPKMSKVAGKVFLGWSKDVNGAEGFDWDFDSVLTDEMANQILYAKWIDGYEISYELNGGVNNKKNPSYFPAVSADVTLAIPIRTGYTFDGWFLENKFLNQITRISNVFKQDLVLYAKWTENSNGGSSGGRSGGGSRGVLSIKETKTEKVVNHKEKILDSDGNKSEMELAYDFAFKNGITTMDSIDGADMYGSLTRIAMAKMLSNYAINILGKVPSYDKFPSFNDVSLQLNSEYGNGVILAYQLGIMGIGIDEFRPFDLVTRAEFVTALSRMLYGLADGTNNYYEPHMDKLASEGVVTDTNPDIEEIRGYVMIMLMRSDKPH